MAAASAESAADAVASSPVPGGSIKKRSTSPGPSRASPPSAGTSTQSCSVLPARASVATAGPMPSSLPSSAGVSVVRGPSAEPPRERSLSRPRESRSLSVPRPRPPELFSASSGVFRSARGVVRASKWKRLKER